MEDFIRIFKSLSDETRFKLINVLLAQDLCVGALAHRLGISEAAVSQHLKHLREAGLVRGEKRGYWTHYTVDRSRLSELAEFVRGLTNTPANPEEGCTHKSNQENDCSNKSSRARGCTRQDPGK